MFFFDTISYSMKIDIKTKLKRLRMVNNFTQDYVAKQLGITRASYTKYELGYNQPPIDLIPKLVKLYNVEPNFFFDYELKPNNNNLQQLFEIAERFESITEVNNYWEFLADQAKSFLKYFGNKDHT